VKRPHEKLVFVTSGGKPHRHATSYLNKWNTDKGYPQVSINMIRRAYEDAAAAQGADADTEVARHLAHSVATAERHYRTKDLDSAVRQGIAVERAQDNYRALKRVSSNCREFFAAYEEFPSHEELEERFRRDLKRKNFKLSSKTYQDIKDMYDGEYDNL